MYAGLGSSLLVSINIILNIFFYLQGIFPYVGIKMATFDILKTSLNVQRSDPNFISMNMLIGAISGFTTIMLTYPTDLIRRRMQMRGQDGNPNYKNFFDCGY